MKLQVQVIEAKGLASRDTNGFSDPYVRLQLGKTKVKTNVVQKNLNPSWYEEFFFKLDDLKSELLISVWDKDAFSDEFLGQIKLPVSQVLNSENQTLLPAWYPLQKRNRKSKSPVSGEILLGFSLYGRTFNDTTSVPSPDSSPVVDLPNNAALIRGTSIESAASTEIAGSSLSFSSADSLKRSGDKEDSAFENQKPQNKSFGQKVTSLFSKKSRDISSATKYSQDQSPTEPLLSEVENIEEDDSMVSLSFFNDDEKMTGASGKHLPEPLSGGVLVDQRYAVGFRTLNAILFKPGSPFQQELVRAQGTTNFVEEPWKKAEDGSSKRLVSYTKAPSNLVKAVDATEEQVYTRADDDGFVVNISVSTPAVPYGSNFRTELQMCIEAGPKRASGEKSSHLRISWQMNFLHNTFMRGLIERGAHQGLKESFRQFVQVLQNYADAISDEPNSFALEEQEQAARELDFGSDYFSNIAVILAFLTLFIVLLHICLPWTTNWIGLERLGLDLPDSFGELLTSLLITLQLEHAVKLAFRTLQTRGRVVCLGVGGDHGIKAQGEGWLLTITLLEGEHLQLPQNSRYADPYVIFTCNGKTRTSSVKLQTLNPQWKEVFEFDATEDPPSTMDIEVLDFEGPFSEGESLGYAEMNFLKTSTEDLADFWVSLHGEKGQLLKSRLHLRILLSNNSDNSDVFQKYAEKMEKEVGEKIVRRSAKRNLSFQKLFSLPIEEFLINDFACAVKRKIPLQGRLFLSPRVLGFYSNLFGHKVKFILLWEDIEDIIETTPTLGSVRPLFNPSILIFVRKGRGTDAQHGAKTADPKGRLKFQFQSFVRTGPAFRTIIALWKNRTLSLEQQMEIVSNIECDAKVIEGEGQADDDGDFLGIEEANMKEVYSTILPLTVESMMLIYQRENIEEKIMGKLGGSVYTSTPWEPSIDKPGVHQRQLSYKLTRRLCQFGSTVTCIQQKEISSDRRHATVDELLTLHDVPFGDHFQLQVRKELENESMDPPSSSCKVYVGIAWYKFTAFQKRINQNIFQNFTRYLQESLDMAVKEVLLLKEENNYVLV